MLPASKSQALAMLFLGISVSFTFVVAATGKSIYIQNCGMLTFYSALCQPNVCMSSAKERQMSVTPTLYGPLSQCEASTILEFCSYPPGKG